MSHSTVLVVLPAATVEDEGIENALAAALEPFDENRKTPTYVKLTRQQAIDKERQRLIDYRDNGYYAEYLKDPEAYAAQSSNPGHVEYLRTEFPKKLDHLNDNAWLYEQAIQYETVNEDGDITSTYNPQSKWDWWAIGGRWSGGVLNADEVIHHEAKVYSERYTQPAWDEHAGGVDFLQKKDLTSFQGTFAFLHADGEWHERAHMGWFGMTSDEKDAAVWEQQQQELLAAVRDEDWLVVVDIHI